MKHPDHDISFYIHSSVCQHTGHCNCPEAEETKTADETVSCKIRGLIGNQWRYTFFINITKYEVEMLADYERFYKVVVIFNGEIMEQRFVDRRDSSTIFVLRPNHDSDPEYRDYHFAICRPAQICDKSGKLVRWAGSWSWLIEFKVSYGKLGGFSSTTASTCGPNRVGSGLARGTPNSQPEGDLLAHFKFIGGPHPRFKDYETPEPKVGAPHDKAGMSSVLNASDGLDMASLGVSPQPTLPMWNGVTQNFRDGTDEKTYPAGEGVGCSLFSGRHNSRTQTIAIQDSNSARAAVLKFAVDLDSALTITEDPDTSLIFSSVTPPLSRPQAKWDLQRVMEIWEENLTGPKVDGQDLMCHASSNMGTEDQIQVPPPPDIVTDKNSSQRKVLGAESQVVFTEAALKPSPDPRFWAPEPDHDLNYLKENDGCLHS